ncbi:MAG: hypothetical protein V3W41_17460 [Planctomycetota bacterium]
MFKEKGKHRHGLAPYRRQRFLCTAGEWRFCEQLEEAVGDRFTVMMQVRVGSLLRVPAKVSAANLVEGNSAIYRHAL